MNNKDYISHVGWYNEGTKQFEKLYREEYVEELKDKLDIFMVSNKSFLETINNLRKEITRLNKIIDDLREYMVDIDYKMGWQYAEYLDELLGIKSNYKKYGLAIDLKEEGKE